MRQATFEQQIRAEQKMAAEALRASEERFRRIVTFAPIGIYQCDREGSFMLVNDVLVRMLGYTSSEELLKRNLMRDIYFTSNDRNAVSEELLAAGKAVKTLAAGVPAPMTVTAARRVGDVTMTMIAAAAAGKVAGSAIPRR